MPLESAFNTIGSSTKIEPTAVVELAPCDKRTFVHNVLQQVGEGVRYEWHASRAPTAPLQLRE
eukprot:483153-Prymnesium_polylepis.1